MLKVLNEFQIPRGQIFKKIECLENLKELQIPRSKQRLPIELSTYLLILEEAAYKNSAVRSYAPKPYRSLIGTLKGTPRDPLKQPPIFGNSHMISRKGSLNPFPRPARSDLGSALSESLLG